MIQVKFVILPGGNADQRLTQICTSETDGPKHNQIHRAFRYIKKNPQGDGKKVICIADATLGRICNYDDGRLRITYNLRYSVKDNVFFSYPRNIAFH